VLVVLVDNDGKGDCKVVETQKIEIKQFPWLTGAVSRYENMVLLSCCMKVVERDKLDEWKVLRRLPCYYLIY